MPAVATLVVKVPLPRLTTPEPENVSPPLRLMAPLGAAWSVPWQFTGSVMLAQPPSVWLAAMESVLPSVCSMPALL